MPGLPGWMALLDAIRWPVPPETGSLLRDAWNRLPKRLQTANQFLGRQYIGCAATIGVMPRCDFACRGCYLNRGANRVPYLPIGQIREQLVRIREWVGHGGNVQLTDGEVTLRPAAELIGLVRFARSIGLVPMLMTHGETIRRDPELLKRLVQEGGLSELSIHIDTTQRGRRGPEYRFSESELELEPLREEFARLIRDVLRETGKKLEVATTLTVTGDNICDVPDVIRWICRNADAFRMISLQPAAQVGRTKPGLGGAVGVEALWRQIVRGLGADRNDADGLLRHHGSFGHPACSRFLQGLIVASRAGPPLFSPLVPADDARGLDVLHGWYDRFGGLTFRLDTRSQAVARLLGVLAREPVFVLAKVLPYAWRRLRWLSAGKPWRFIAGILRGKTTVRYLNIVTHHFMSRDELDSPLGRERVSMCAFRVPIGAQMRSMCEVNATGIRERYYDAMAEAT